MLSRVDKPRRAVPLERGLAALADALGPDVRLEQQQPPADHMYGLCGCRDLAPGGDLQNYGGRR